MTDNGSSEALRGYKERLDRITNEIAELQADRRELKKEIKDAGFDVKALEEIINEEKLDADARAKRHERLENKRLYARELGVTPIEDWIERQAESSE